jgi:hypothetical protein
VERCEGGTGRRLAAGLAGLVLLGACAGVLSSRTPHSEFARWQAEAASLRGLEFLTPVEMRWITAEQIGAIIRGELERTLPSELEDEYRDAYASLGLLPRDMDLSDALIQLQTSELVGLYSVHDRTMYVVESKEAITGYDPTVIVVHEMVHALQHQHFPAAVRTIQGLRHNDDLVTAVAAALEGDASLTMLAVSEDDADGRTIAGARQLRDAMLVDVEFPEGTMAQAPLLLRISLIFPYAEGTLLAASRFAEQGNRGLDALMRQPPLSTLRVLHPDDRDPVEFLALPLEPLVTQLEERGCRVGHHNVAGVLTLRVLFEQYGAAKDLEPLLRAWSGDRFAHIVCADSWELAWVSRWDDEKSAAAFARRYESISSSAAGAAGFTEPPSVTRSGRSVLVLSAGLREHGDLIRERLEIRSYDSYAAWVAGGCFSEPACP